MTLTIEPDYPNPTEQGPATNGRRHCSPRCSGTPNAVYLSTLLGYELDIGERASCDSRATAAAIRETPRNRSSNVTVFDLDLVILGWHPRSNRQHRVYVLIGKKANIMKMTTSSNQAWESYSAWSKYNAQLRQTPGAGSSNENAS
jgi:hypothetical protein